MNVNLAAYSRSTQQTQKDTFTPSCSKFISQVHKMYFLLTPYLLSSFELMSVFYKTNVVVAAVEIGLNLASKIIAEPSTTEEREREYQSQGEGGHKRSDRQISRYAQTNSIQS